MLELLERNDFFSYLTGECLHHTIYNDGKDINFIASTKEEIEVMLALYPNASAIDVWNGMLQIAHNYL